MVTRRQVRRAIELHESELSAHPDVVGIGTEWDTEKRAKGEQRQHAVAVYVSQRSEAESATSPIPSILEIPARSGVHLIRVVVKEIGTIEPEEEVSATDDDRDSGHGQEFAPQ